MKAYSSHHRKQLLFSLCLVWLMPGCDGDSNTTEKPGTSLAVDTPQVKNLLIFPKELQTANQKVNDFLSLAMTAAASGDYDTFRSLWSTKTEPLSKQEFDQGWRAVKAIRIMAIEKIKVAKDGKQPDSKPVVAYLVKARVEFDPLDSLGGGIENREAICLIEYEQNQWRLANAPQAMRAWLQEKTASRAGSHSQNQPTQPTPTASGS